MKRFLLVPLILAGGSAIAGQQPSLVISADKSAYLVGERIVLRVELRNDTAEAMTVSLAVTPRLRATTIWHRAPGGESAALDLTTNEHITGTGTKTLQGGESVLGTWLLAVRSFTAVSSDLVLDRSGRHEIRVAYRVPTNGEAVTISSNTLPLDVIAPPPDELQASNAYTREMAYATQLDWGEGFISLAEQAAAEDFLRRFSDSRYAPPLKEGLKNWLDYRIRIQAANAEEKARFDRLSGNDSIGPTLALSTTPTALWPPNKKLVSVTMSVTASDDSGAVPTIKLVSITCNDGCNASADVTGAAFGTDDRAFMRRADRTGGGNGRSYQITYEATDGAGNKTTATASVVVPHDQGHE